MEKLRRNIILASVSALVLLIFGAILLAYVDNNEEITAKAVIKSSSELLPGIAALYVGIISILTLDALERSRKLFDQKLQDTMRDGFKNWTQKEVDVRKEIAVMETIRFANIRYEKIT